MALGFEHDREFDKKLLRRDAWLCDDPVWWWPPKSSRYVLMTYADCATLRDEFLAHGRINAYPQPAAQSADKP